MSLGIQFFGGDDEAGNVFVVETKADAGQLLESHVHEHAHTSVLVSGTAKVTIDGVEEIMAGYRIVAVPKNTAHSVEAITPIVWLCLWAGDIAPRERAQESLKLIDCQES
jgi:quercetin dioxygenase-like cupin family protein